MRAPDQNNPVQDVSSPDIACGQVALTSPDVISVTAGSKLGAWYQHVIGGPQGENDPDNPIAASHHGPLSAWLAPVDDAASADHTSLEWFKIAEDTFDVSSGVWGVDNMITNNGWYDFTLPACVADGQYLLRVEIIALHSAYESMGAQFYQSCAQIEVSGGGSFSPAETVGFPGAYAQDDPAIMTNIYGEGGVANNNGQEYNHPGPAPISC